MNRYPLIILPPPLANSTHKHTENRGEGGRRRKKQTFVIPPSTTKSVPLTNPLSSLASHSTACACSTASPKRPVGKWISRRWRLALSVPRKVCRRGVLWVFNFVSFCFLGRRGKGGWGVGEGGKRGDGVEGGRIYLRGAGQRALKRMFSRAWTMASSRVRARTAPLLLCFRQSSRSGMRRTNERDNTVDIHPSIDDRPQHK